MDYKYFDSIYGLVTDNDRKTENAGLFLAESIVLHNIFIELYNKGIDKLAGIQLSTFESKMLESFVEQGLYKRTKFHNLRAVSQDEITGMIVSSYLLGTSHKQDITHYLATHFGNYPATGTNKFYNPADYYAWFRLSGNWTQILSYLFLLFYIINLLISSNKEKQNTSSKLMYMVELYCLNKESICGKLMWKYFKWRMKLMYGEKWIKGLIDIYFHMEKENHPLRYLANMI